MGDDDASASDVQEIHVVVVVVVVVFGLRERCRASGAPSAE
jgi:Sec-independent protein translocase protein TatA